MSRKNVWFAVLAVVAALIGLTAHAEAAVEGDLADWGITMNSNGKNMDYDDAYGHGYVGGTTAGGGQGWRSTPGVFLDVNDRRVHFHLEDTRD